MTEISAENPRNLFFINTQIPHCYVIPTLWNEFYFHLLKFRFSSEEISAFLKKVFRIFNFVNRFFMILLVNFQRINMRLDNGKYFSAFFDLPSSFWSRYTIYMNTCIYKAFSLPITGISRKFEEKDFSVVS